MTKEILKRAMQAHQEAIKDEVYFRGYGRVQDCLITVTKGKKKRIMATEGAD